MSKPELKLRSITKGGMSQGEFAFVFAIFAKLYFWVLFFGLFLIILKKMHLEFLPSANPIFCIVCIF